MNTEIRRIVNDPSWLAHRFDPGYDAVHLLRLSRAERDDATFLVDDYLKTAGDPLVLTRRDAAAALSGPKAPRHFLFHSAFCCSTLLARALDVPGVASAFKEPVVLNDLVGWRRRGAGDAAFGATLRDALDLLGRPFERGEAAVVKPANIANVIAPALIAAQPATHAVLMYAPLETFLTSVAKKGIDGRLWVRGLFAGLMQDGITDFGYDAGALFGQTDLQIAALGWLAQQRLFLHLLTGPLGARVRSLRSDVLLRDPVQAIVHLDRLFSLGLDEAAATAIGTGPAFGRHSKTGAAFGASERRAEYAQATDLYADEVNKVAIWAGHVADANGIPLDLPQPLVA